MIEVLGVDVGDDGDGGGEVEEGSVGLVRLDDDPFALSQLGVGTESVELSADHGGGVETRVIEDGGDEGSGGGLSVRAGDGDRVLQAHQLGEHLRTSDDGHSARAGSERLGILRTAHGAGSHHHVHVAGHVLGAMADVDGSTQPGEPLGGLAFLEVGSAHAVAEVEEELRDPAHPDAADADEVHAPGLSQQSAPSRNLQIVLWLRAVDVHSQEPRAASDTNG